MSWGGNGRNSGVWRMYTHAEASAHYDKTLPIRGRTPEFKPLGRRGAVDAYSMRRADNGDIECFLYSSKVVTYHTDDTITLANPSGTSTMSLANLVQDLLRIAAYQHDYKLEISLSGNHYAINSNKSFRLKYIEGKLVAVDAPTATVHKVDRKQANIVRRKYADVYGYLTGMAKVRETYPSNEELTGLFGEEERSYINSAGREVKWKSLIVPRLLKSNPEEVEQLFKWLESDDPHENYTGAAWLMWQSQSNQYYSQRKGPVHVEALMSTFNLFVLARHKHEVFKVEELPEGVVRKDRYSWAFN
jgi:hypothetical protein